MLRRPVAGCRCQGITGSRPLGGGGVSSSGSLFADLNSSFPQARSWRVDENNAGATDAVVRAITVCGRLAGYVLAGGTPSTITADSQVLTTVACPANTVSIGGGALVNSTSVGVNINATASDSDAGWFSYVNNASRFDVTASSIAVCVGA